MKQQSPIDSFTTSYSLGHHLDALLHIFPTAESSLDDHTVESLFEKQILNYADALAFSFNTSDLLHINTTLQNTLTQTPSLLKYHQHFYHSLKIDEYFINSLFTTSFYKDILELNTPLTDEHPYVLLQEKYLFLKRIFQPLGIAEDISNSRFITLQKQLAFHKRLSILFECKPHLFNLYNIQNYPYLPLKAPLRGKETLWQTRFYENIKGTPCILLFPYQMDWEQLSLYLKENRAIFLFLNRAHLLHSLQYPDLVEILRHPKHLILSLDTFINQQCRVQQSLKMIDPKLKMIILSNQKYILDNIPDIKNYIETILEQPSNALTEETPVSIALYQLGQRINYQNTLDRLGPSRFFALESATVEREKFDPYFPTMLHYPSSQAPQREKAYYAALNQKTATKKRPLKKRAPYRIAHVTPSNQLHSYCPSFKQIQSLFTHYSNKSLKPYLISFSNPNEYPFLGNNAPPCNDPQFPESIPYLTIEKKKTLEETAQALATLFKENEIDIAYFHEYSPLNVLCAHLSDVPLFIQEQSSEHDLFIGFSLAIIKNEWELERWKCKQLPIELTNLPFQYNPKIQWEKTPYPKKFFGLSPDSLLLTTISGNLQVSLNPSTCHTVAQILKRIPRAYYLPMGPISNTAPVYAIFDQYHVSDRVMFLHEQEAPSQLARSMDLYLCETHYSTSQGVLEAMSAGLPIVCMYQNTGPYFFRENAYYLEHTFSINTESTQDYINLACQLLSDPNAYEKWREHSLKRSLKFSAPKTYTERFETLIFNHIKTIRKSLNQASKN